MPYASDGHKEFRTWAAAWPGLHFARHVPFGGRSDVGHVYTSRGEAHCSGIIKTKKKKTLVEHSDGPYGDRTRLRYAAKGCLNGDISTSRSTKLI